ncbi:glycogen/starch synthase [bacterium]|nr:glycogen/starch synthase [bacterium]
MAKTFKILFVAPECRGLVSVGGMAEVVFHLASALRAEGHDVRICLPFYACLKNSERIEAGPLPTWSADLGLGDLPPAAVYSARFGQGAGKLNAYLVGGHAFFEQADRRESIYASDPVPYFFLNAAMLRFLDRPGADWIPDVIHCHDYHAGLLPVYLNTVFRGALGGRKPGTVLTIHNLAFQGVSDAGILKQTGLPENLADFKTGLRGMEYFGKINCLKGAIGFSDVVTTVSKTYAAEILFPEHGMGLDGLLSLVAAQGRLKGIVNGIDNRTWDPAVLPAGLSYSEAAPGPKTRCRDALVRSAKLEEGNDPVLSMRSRWSFQKGFELLLYAIRIHKLHEKARIVVAAWNPPAPDQDPEYFGLWMELTGWASCHPRRIAFLHEDHIPQTDMHYAGSDMILMPSLFEPCGLAQMEAMRYGTIPIVRATGGLSDTVDPSIGFTFKWPAGMAPDPAQKKEGVRIMMACIDRAIQSFRNESDWNRRMKKAMSLDNGWHSRIPDYVAAYRQAMKHAQS